MAYHIGQQVETVSGVGIIKEIRNTIGNTLVYLIQVGNTQDIFEENEFEEVICPGQFTESQWKETRYGL